MNYGKVVKEIHLIKHLSYLIGLKGKLNHNIKFLTLKQPDLQLPSS